MKIVIINTSEKVGGAAIAAKRLMKALNKSGQVEVKMLVRDMQTSDPDVYTINRSSWKKFFNYLRFIWERIFIFFNNNFNRKLLFQVSIANTGINISKQSLIKEADIIHLHWFNQAFLSLNDLKKLLSLNKPIVWTTHDMWPCTGICHYSQDCTKFRNECRGCFYLGKKNKKDLSSKIFYKKRKIYNNGNLYFVSCSNWLKEELNLSSLTNKFNKTSIPNPIDINVYTPLNSDGFRKQLNLPLEKKLILFGALNINDERKGIKYLIEGLKSLKDNYPNVHGNIELVVFGRVKEEVEVLFDIPIHSMGYLEEDEKIVQLYNAVDIYITTSLEDNLPNTIMEAMSCGLPCIGFNVGGIPEMIDHRKNGYIAGYKSTDDLANGIVWCLDENNYQSLSIYSREKVTACYNESIIVQKYIDLYNQIKI